MIVGQEYISSALGSITTTVLLTYLFITLFRPLLDKFQKNPKLGGWALAFSAVCLGILMFLAYTLDVYRVELIFIVEFGIQLLHLCNLVLAGYVICARKLRIDAEEKKEAEEAAALPPREGE